jgi:hypothetical protein
VLRRVRWAFFVRPTLPLLPFTPSSLPAAGSPSQRSTAALGLAGGPAGGGAGGWPGAGVRPCVKGEAKRAAAGGSFASYVSLQRGGRDEE